MLVNPTQVAENNYISLPQEVCPCIFGLFILEDQQIDLHPKTPSWPCWSVAFSWHSLYVWMPETLITFPFRTPTPRRGWTTRSVSRNVWPSLPSVPPTNLTSTLRMSISLLRPAINCINISCLPFRCILHHTPQSLFDVISHHQSPHYLHHSLGMPWPPSLSSLFHIGIHNCSATFLYGIYCCLNMNCPASPIEGAHQAESYTLAFPRGDPFLHDCHPKNRIASPGARTTASVICSSRPSWNISTINKPCHVWKGGGWLPPPSPRVTLMWML